MLIEIPTTDLYNLVPNCIKMFNVVIQKNQHIEEKHKKIVKTVFLKNINAKINLKSNELPK